MTLKFWVNLFAPLQFRLAEQGLHRYFVNRPKGTRPKNLYNQFDDLLRFRNRIAHAEPICFDTAHQLDTSYARSYYNRLIVLTEWLCFDSADLYQGVDKVLHVIDQIDTL